MILITNATSNFGKHTINHLIKKNINRNHIIGLVTSTTESEWLRRKKIDHRIGNFSDHASLLKAFSGIQRLLLISETGLRHRADQHIAVVKAAKEAGVSHIVYTSVDRKTDNPKSPLKFILKSHYETETAIKESQIPYTILKSNLYAEMLPMFLGSQVFDTGVVFPADEGKVGFALRSEVAEVAANILSSSGHENSEYHISNPEVISFDEIAATLSKIAGRIVPYQSPDLLNYIEAKYNAGFSYEHSSAFAMYGEAINQGELEIVSPDFEYLLGRRPASVKQSLREIFWQR